MPLFSMCQNHSRLEPSQAVTDVKERVMMVVVVVVVEGVVVEVCVCGWVVGWGGHIDNIDNAVVY